MTVSVELPKREQWAAGRTRQALEQEAGRSATAVGEPQGRRRWKEGSRSGGGLGGHAALLPFAAQAGGQRESSPQPSSHRWALWPVIMVPVAPSCARPPQAHYQRQTPSGQWSPCSFGSPYARVGLHSCVHTNVFLFKSSLHEKGLVLWESQVGLETFYTGEDIWWCSGPANPEIKTISTGSRSAGAFGFSGKRWSTKGT